VTGLWEGGCTLECLDEPALTQCCAPIKPCPDSMLCISLPLASPRCACATPSVTPAAAWSASLT
jgi:hypothetical protein